LTVLTRSAILAADDLPREAVNVPEWGGEVFVRTLTGGERDRFEGWIQGDRFDAFRAKLAVLCVCDESGARVFADDDVALLSGKSTKPLDRIVEAAYRLNRFTTADLETIAKN
jgi:hypothetical protein